MQHLDPLFRHDDAADNGHQQQQRGHLERQQVLGEQRVGDALDIAAAAGAAAAREAN